MIKDKDDFLLQMEYNLKQGNDKQQSTAAIALGTFFAFQEKLSLLSIEDLTTFVKKSIAAHLYIMRNPL